MGGGDRCIVPLILDLGSRCRWVVKFRLWPFYTGTEIPVSIKEEMGASQNWYEL